jgi:hypothetical protein
VARVWVAIYAATARRALRRSGLLIGGPASTALAHMMTGSSSRGLADNVIDHRLNSRTST